ncbi:MAG: hypothetical protein O3B86_06635 [Planctomycetota bacterium]|nr:hypothetical protein [Planctomycetota bacterium]
MSILNRRLSITFCLVLVLGNAGTGFTEESDIQLVEQAASQFQPITEERLTNTRALLARDLQCLDLLLAITPENVDAWNRFLHLSVLRDHLTGSGNESVDGLQKVLDAISQDVNGLGMPQFVDLRHDLAYYLTLHADHAAGDAEAEFKEKVDALRTTLQAHQEHTTTETRQRVGKQLGWFSERRQASSLVNSVRQRNSQTNLRVALSDQLIASVVKREINLTTPFTADFSGNSLSGNATTQGTVNSKLVPGKSPAMVQIQFDGRTDLHGFVDYAPVTAQAAGAAGINAGTYVTVSGAGLAAGASWAGAAANVCIYCIQTALPWPVDPLVVGIAEGEVERRRAEFNNTAARGAEEEIHKQLPGQVEAVIGPLNDRYRRDIKYRLQRLDAFPEHIHTRTTLDHLILDITEASPHQLGAPSSPPTMAQKFDAALQLHESALNNVAASMFGDKTFTIRELQQLAEDLAGVPAPTEAIAENEEVAIRFDSDHPITISANNNTLTLSITGKEFIAGRRTYPAITVSVTFQLADNDGIIQATLAGDPVIVPPRLKTAERKALSLRETAIRRILQNRLDRDLVKTVDLKEIPLPSEMQKTGTLKINSASATNGWLTVTAVHSK